jgi:hypothetical protein
LTFQEGKLTFEFPTGWDVAKYDQWSYYRKQFQKVCGSTKAVDFVAIGMDKHLWLIEIKDYRMQRRTKVLDLGEEFGAKVRDSLAGLVAGACEANDASEQQFARKATAAKKIHLILHLEQPKKHSRLFPRVDPANVEIKLRQVVRAIDPHARVLETGNMRGAAWNVQ